MCEQPTLSRETAAIARQLAARANDAVTGNYDSDRIGAIGETNGALRVWLAEARGELAIRAGPRGRYLRQGSPDRSLKWRTRCRPAYRSQRFQFAGEIGLESFGDALRRGLGLQADGAIVEAKQLKHALLVVFEIKRSQNACIVEHQLDRADRRGHSIHAESVRRHPAILRQRPVGQLREDEEPHRPATGGTCQSVRCGLPRGRTHRLSAPPVASRS